MLYTLYTYTHTGLDEAQAGSKTAERNINKLRYADDTILIQQMEPMDCLCSCLQFFLDL